MNQFLLEAVSTTLEVMTEVLGERTLIVDNRSSAKPRRQSVTTSIEVMSNAQVLHSLSSISHCPQFTANDKHTFVLTVACYVNVYVFFHAVFITVN